MKMPKNVGRCAVAFIVALIFDVVGLILLLIGIFSGLSFYDFFIYTGAIVIALSLIFWVLWYTFNVEISYKDLGLTWW